MCVHIDVWQVMLIRLMCLLFSDDLTVTDGIPFVFPSHTLPSGFRIPGNSVWQVGRQGDRGWRVIRYGKQQELPPPFLSTPFSTSSTAGAAGYRFDNGKKKKKKKLLAGAVVCLGKNNFDFYVEEHICKEKKSHSACEGEWLGLRSWVSKCQRVTEEEFLFHNLPVYEWLGGLCTVRRGP